ncbi:MAG TPA: indolepyruvate oxidoreductase subunit beta [Bacteroidales bacterium]|jgi:indolepyruvate ferredoxin oxidoreductase, beta subunit|nr:indolepyruvate oxidoreductase subunit beta [Bacteroidales bacterium]
MKRDIILAGVGGQGIISIAAIIGTAALEQGLFLKQSEVHGMSQRGGDVQSNLRISDKEIASDLIPYGKADLIISVEPLEALRYLPLLSPDGWVITSTKPFINIPEYPQMDKVMDEIRKLPHYIALDADEVAKEIGTLKAANIVILGAASPFLDMQYEKLEDAIRFIFRNKGEEVIKKNLQALEAGKDFTERQMHP